MRFPGTLARIASRGGWHVLSVSIYIKILGIGALAALLFGSVTLVQTRASMSHILYQLLEQRTFSAAHTLAVNLERPMSTNDSFGVAQRLQEAQNLYSDARYIIVRDRTGRVAASTFDTAVPTDLDRVFAKADPHHPKIQVLNSRDGRIVDLVHPILKGHAGTVQVGIMDQMVTKELYALTQAVLWGLGLCAIIGAGLALLLTSILIRPIHYLVRAADQIRQEDFEARARVFSGDEIGALAVAFNQMAEGLQTYRQEAQEKERVRVALIEQIVQAQEDERKSLARELHDQFGQSLLALLLKIQSNGAHDLPAGLRRELERMIRDLIAEVHRLAWGMRPSILDDYGLDSALARHIEEMSRHSGLEIDYQYTQPPGLGRLPSRVEVTLYRVAQEAITNIVRHAAASRASVVVIQQRSDIVMLVEDDGKGIRPDLMRTRGSKSLGLTGMKERVALLGGSCAIESVPGEGTTIRVRIPLNEEVQCPSVS